MSVAIKERPVSTPRKPLGGLWRRLTGPLKRLTGPLKRFTGPLKRLPGTLMRFSGPLKRLPGTLKPLLRALRKPLSVVRDALATPARYVRNHWGWLWSLPSVEFVPVMGLWTVALKTALLAVAGLLTVYVFRPYGVVTTLFASPLDKVAGGVTRLVYQAPVLELNWALIATPIRLVVEALVFPALTAVVAQYVTLDTLARVLYSRKLRIALSLAATGVVYLLAWGDLAGLVTGAVVGIPLTWTYLHWRRRTSAAGACVVSGGVHAVANAVFVLFQAIFGGV